MFNPHFANMLRISWRSTKWWIHVHEHEVKDLPNGLTLGNVVRREGPAKIRGRP